MVFGATSSNPNIAFENFIQTAIKDFTLFKGRLNEDNLKFLEKVHDESVSFDIKPKTIQIDRET